MSMVMEARAMPRLPLTAAAEPNDAVSACASPYFIASEVLFSPSDERARPRSSLTTCPGRPLAGAYRSVFTLDSSPL